MIEPLMVALKCLWLDLNIMAVRWFLLSRLGCSAKIITSGNHCLFDFACCTAPSLF